MLLAAAVPAAAKQKPITGSVAKGYTVIALADNGRAATAKGPKFKLVPPAKTVTVQLRDAKGAYAGPVVVGLKKTTAIEGIKAGANLGKLRMKHGYAVPAKPLAKKFIDVKHEALATRAGPIGAGRLGFVKSKAAGPAGPGRDADRDGIPGAFDVDDDGDLVLDNVDPPARTARAALAVPLNATPWWVINAGLEVSYISDDTGRTQGAAGYALNQDAAGPFANDANFEKLRDTIMKDRGELFFLIDDTDPSQLDCGGLSYCRPGGTGFSHTRDHRFPDQFDDDKNGFGLMTAAGAFAEGQNGLGTMQAFSPNDVFGLAPMAGANEIESGQAFIQKFARGVDQPMEIDTIFGTVPALQSWSDGTTDHPITYPVPRGGNGSESTPFEIDKNAGGDYVVTLSVWRPQRRPIPGSDETAPWIDMGQLFYTVVGKTVEQNRRVWHCPDSALTPVGDAYVGESGHIVDGGSDGPVNPANTMKFTVNLSACMRASGLGDWKPGDPPSDIFITALSNAGDAAEGGGFAFKPKTAGASADQFTGTWKFPNGTVGPTIDWTVTANSADTGHFGIIAYSPRAITAGTTPAGWTCHLGSAGPNPMWECTGGSLTAGQSVSGQVTLNQDGQDNMPLDMLICDASNQCKGFGMTQQK